MREMWAVTVIAFPYCILHSSRVLTSFNCDAQPLTKDGQFLWPPFPSNRCRQHCCTHGYSRWQPAQRTSIHLLGSAWSYSSLIFNAGEKQSGHSYCGNHHEKGKRGEKSRRQSVFCWRFKKSRIWQKTLFCQQPLKRDCSVAKKQGATDTQQSPVPLLD